jgi:hypothetical protein
VVERSLRSLALVIGAVVLMSFTLFAVDETRTASDGTRAAIRAGETYDAFETSAPAPAMERTRERDHGAAREVVDDANDLFVAPFAPLVRGSQSAWVRRAVPSALALLIFGVGLAFLARWATARPGRRPAAAVSSRR